MKRRAFLGAVGVSPFLGIPTFAKPDDGYDEYFCDELIELAEKHRQDSSGNFHVARYMHAYIHKAKSDRPDRKIRMVLAPTHPMPVDGLPTMPISVKYICDEIVIRHSTGDRILKSREGRK